MTLRMWPALAGVAGDDEVDALPGIDGELLSRTLRGEERATGRGNRTEGRIGGAASNGL